METLVYISISIATVLYIVGFIMLIRYKHDKIKRMEEELHALNNILDSCDKMVSELNNVSDYVISNMEEKSEKLKKLITKADNKIKDLDLQMKLIDKPEQLTMNILDEKKTKTKTETKETSKKDTKQAKRTSRKNENLEEDISVSNGELVTKPISSAINAYENNLKVTKKSEVSENKESRSLFDKIIMEDPSGNDNKKYAFVINPKAKDVIELSRQGLDTTEIAKRLDIGKGEIELILGLKK